MKITEDVGKYAVKQGINESEALESGMQQKAKAFAEKGAEVYVNGWLTACPPCAGVSRAGFGVSPKRTFLLKGRLG